LCFVIALVSPHSVHVSLCWGRLSRSMIPLPPTVMITHIHERLTRGLHTQD
jgi:hypothetical protein